MPEGVAPKLLVTFRPGPVIRVLPMQALLLITAFAGTGEKGYAGDGGPAAKAQLNQPFAVAFDTAGNLYFSDTGNHRVRKVDAKTRTITTVAGNGKKGFAGDGGPA